MVYSEAESVFGLYGSVDGTILHRRYLSLIRRFHPDVGGSKMDAQKIIEAYYILQLPTVLIPLVLRQK